MSARRTATSAKPLYADLLPKPLRAPPKYPRDRLSFVRPYRSFGGFSAWDPPQPCESVLKEVFKDPELKDFRSNDASWMETVKYHIGCEVGIRAAREYMRYLKNRHAQVDGFLQTIAVDMLGKPSDVLRHAEAIGFFGEIDELMAREFDHAPNRSKQKRKFRGATSKKMAQKKTRRPT